MRGMAGGLAGGFLGSMLFSSMGQAKNADGSPAGGGVGFLEIILFGGLAYFGFRWWKNRQATAAFSHASVRHGGGYQTLQREAAAAIEPSQLGHVRALADSGAVLTTDEASDLFFKVQGAWTRRDLSPIKAVLGPEMHDSLSDDLGALKARHHINRLENIAVRSTEVLNAWQEAGADYTSVRFSANLLDYTVDETTGKVMDGDDVTPVKFQEDWTFAKATPSAPWQLVGIAQV
jgi:predicted lipid-binding transport protein (Tim44 family)